MHHVGLPALSWGVRDETNMQVAPIFRPLDKQLLFLGWESHRTQMATSFHSGAVEYLFVEQTLYLDACKGLAVQLDPVSTMMRMT